MEYTVSFGGSKAKPVPLSIKRHLFGRGRLPISSFRIELDGQIPGMTNVYKPGECIKGNLFMSSFEDFGCLGIIVSLQGEAITSYGSGSSTKKKTEDLLHYNSNEWTLDFLVGNLNDTRQFNFSRPKFYIVEKSRIETVSPFSLQIKKLNPFPGTFKGASGEIRYFVMAYVVTRNMRAVKQDVIIEGYLNIQATPKLLLPLTLKGGQSSFFYSGNDFKYCLTLTAGGYVAGEVLSYHVYLRNPERRHIGKFLVSLIKKITCINDVTTKSSKTVVASKSDEFVENLSERRWQNFLLVPADLPPAFQGITIRIQYFIKVDLFSREYPDSPMTIKGEWPITIGSVREDESLSFENLPLSRSLSVISLTSSTGSSVALPPAYEQILSRTLSMETLPPHYDDLFLKE